MTMSDLSQWISDSSEEGEKGEGEWASWLHSGASSTSHLPLTPKLSLPITPKNRRLSVFASQHQALLVQQHRVDSPQHQSRSQRSLHKKKSLQLARSVSVAKAALLSSPASMMLQTPAGASQQEQRQQEKQQKATGRKSGELSTAKSMRTPLGRDAWRGRPDGRPGEKSAPLGRQQWQQRHSTDERWGSAGDKLRRGSSSAGQYSHQKRDSIALLESIEVERLLKAACVISLLTVCLNTARTFQFFPLLEPLVLVADAFVLLVFTAEAVIKAFTEGEGGAQCLFSLVIHDRWCQFDFAMLLFHWVSFALHLYKIAIHSRLLAHLSLPYREWLAVVRCVRPMVIIRLIRLLLRFKLPRNRIQQLLKRSSTQVKNVTVFFVFFMALYAIIGIQLFGRLDYHCVMPGTNPKNVTINDLAIPDTMCSRSGGGGYECPGNMECMRVDLSAKAEGFYGMFDHFGSSVFTVYLAASEEGWVYVLYDCLDSMPSHFAFVYFVTLIFFLAWLVKNVFIAVITETFAEIRVQFSEMWGHKSDRAAVSLDDEFRQRLVRDENGNWQLIRVDKEQRYPPGSRMRLLQGALNSTAFQCVVVALVLANAGINASFVYSHSAKDVRRRRLYYYIECGFTALFNVECLVKLACYGWSAYFKRNIHKFEFLLCVGSSLNVVPPFYARNIFTYFQVFRLFRLIKASPILEDFVYKIFSPGKKLGGLVIFTITFIIIASAVSLQLFCSVQSLHHFQTFPQAFMAMFQIITQEGWTEFVVEVLRAMDDRMVPFVAVYFVAYHLFVTLIVLSLFVAVILDNLEMDEELKKIKQLRAKEAITSLRSQLPWRLRVFEHFPTRPQMVELRQLRSWRTALLDGCAFHGSARTTTAEFPTPKIRDSFANQFVWEFEEQVPERWNFPVYATAAPASMKFSTGSLRSSTLATLSVTPFHSFASGLLSRRRRMLTAFTRRHVGHATIRASVGNLVRSCAASQMHSQSNQLGGIATVASKTVRSKSMGILVEQMLENGDIRQHHQVAPSTLLAEGEKAAAQAPPPPPPPAGMVSSASMRRAAITATTTIVGLGLANTDERPTAAPEGGGASSQLVTDFRLLQQRRQMAEMARNRIEEEMRENHPFFDRPLFFVGRESPFRRFCARVAHARFGDSSSSGIGGGPEDMGSSINARQTASMSAPKQGGKKHKQLRALIGLMPYLDWVMIGITLVSCVSMLFESPWPTTGENLVMFNVYLQVPDYFFVLSMTFELACKVVSDGLLFTPNAVVRDFGGVMTLFIWITSLTFLVTMPKHVETNSPQQFLMICRAMRPLRIYTLVPHIKRVVMELVRGFKEIALVTILMIVVMFIFASYGVQTVGGRLAACNDLTITSRKNCTGVFWQKLFVTRMEVFGKNSEELHPKILVPRVWTNPRNFNFDHIGAAMLALFETLSYKGWNVIRDILWARQGPWAVVFIHLYVFIGCMIGLTLFVGVVIANYTENRGTALLTVDQRRWHDLKARLKMAQPLHIPPKPAESAVLRRRIYEATLSRAFNQFFFALVVLNSATLLLPWHVEEEEEWKSGLFLATTASVLINCLFALECLLKVVAYTMGGFWQSRRNRIDLLITTMCMLWVLMHFFVFALPALSSGGGSGVRGSGSRSSVSGHMPVPTIRLKRFTYTFGYLLVILRFFTIAGRNNTLKMLMLTVVMSMFRSFFIIMAMALLVLFYAYTGVILFGMVKFGQAVSKHVNFRTGPAALVVLFRSVTGEDWNDIMHDTSISAPYCYWEPGANYWHTDCGNYYGAIIYFCSFYLIITYIVRNLLVAIIIENFSLFYSSEEDALLSYADIRNFQLVWNTVDVEQKGSIPVERVKYLLRLLRGRLEVDPNKDRLLFKHMCYEMERLHSGDDVSFHDVLYMLSYRSVDIRKSLQLEELLEREELEYLIEEEVAKQTIKTWLEFCLKRRRQRSPIPPPQSASTKSSIAGVSIGKQSTSRAGKSFKQQQQGKKSDTTSDIALAKRLIAPIAPTLLSGHHPLLSPVPSAKESFDASEPTIGDGQSTARRTSHSPSIVGTIESTSPTSAMLLPAAAPLAQLQRIKPGEQPVIARAHSIRATRPMQAGGTEDPHEGTEQTPTLEAAMASDRVVAGGEVGLEEIHHLAVRSPPPMRKVSAVMPFPRQLLDLPQPEERHPLYSLDSWAAGLLGGEEWDVLELPPRSTLWSDAMPHTHTLYASLYNNKSPEKSSRAAGIGNQFANLVAMGGLGSSGVSSGTATVDEVKLWWARCREEEDEEVEEIE